MAAPDIALELPPKGLILNESEVVVMLCSRKYYYKVSDTACVCAYPWSKNFNYRCYELVDDTSKNEPVVECAVQLQPNEISVFCNDIINIRRERGANAELENKHILLYVDAPVYTDFDDEEIARCLLVFAGFLKPEDIVPMALYVYEFKHKTIEAKICDGKVTLSVKDSQNNVRCIYQDKDFTGSEAIINDVAKVAGVPRDLLCSM